MQTAPTADCRTTAGPLLRRLLSDLGVALIISVSVALIITLVSGHPELLAQELVYSVLIGVGGFIIVDLARLRLWPGPGRRPHQWCALLGVTAIAAASMHFFGVQLGSLLFGVTTPGLSGYLTIPRLSMALLTFICLGLMILVLEHRERLARIARAHSEAQLHAAVIARQAMQAQLRLLQAQIEPHMLFNTLANLQGLIGLDPVRAEQMLDQLIQYLRATLGAARADSTTLAAEFAAMQAYLGLMGVRMGARLRYRLELPATLRAVRLPPMLLQPLVENAIVHGLEPSIEGGEVVVSAQVHAAQLVLTVRDSGLGLCSAAASHGGGVGVATTRERLHALYGTRATVVLTAAPLQGTLVRLCFPLETI